ncbi:isoleucine--tRNA ligase [Halorutilales archaeon Cl-col2-1]
MDEVSDQYDPHEVEPEVKEYWDREDAYEHTKEVHEDDPDYFFVDGPPYTSGQMHLGTAWNKTLKDAVIRYLRMRGHNVTDRPGYDMHGLPIEVKVEEELGFENKSDIEEFGVENFIDECKEFAESNLDVMNDDFESLGVWMDWDDPYRTVSNEYMEAAWWGFKKAHDRDLVEQGKRVINQCPRCETAIADAEVEYDEIESPSIYVKFPVKGEDAYLVIWTTTPWTIPANIYVGVDPETEYAKVRAEKNGETDVLYVAEDLVEDVLRKGRYDDYEVVETLDADELEGKEYTHPLEDEVPKQREFDGDEDVHRVYAADFVTSERTGLVHAAPGHGLDDFEFGSQHDLPVFSPVGGDGVYTEDAGEYAGEFVRDANDDVIEDLDSKGLLLSSGSHEHRYGHCWRCDTPIIFIATDQWFITVTDIKDDLLDEIDKSDWYPDWARDSRFRDWVENARDWNVSRQRYWGIPIPIWICDEGHETCIGTRDELRQKALDDVDEVDLHRPGVDPIRVECDVCGSEAERVEDIFDVWLDSSVASWGTLGYPSNDEEFERLWPADLIIEAHDQTRGWFWSQLGMGVSALDQIPYEKVLMHGHALDEDGLKMSKSRGNIVTPQEAIERYGVDPLRTFLLSHNQKGEDMRFSWDELEETQRKLNVFWNTYRFPLPYMDLDDFDPNETTVEDVELTKTDEWVLSRLETVKSEFSDEMEEFEIHKALNELIEFITDDVSRFYIQVVRPRMWEEEDSDDKLAAYATLYRVLDESVRMIAPFAPHIAERMYDNLGDAKTVHALDWPSQDEKYRDEKLEQRIDVLREIEETAANARQKAGRKLRWPVKRIVVDTDDETVRDAVEALEDLLLNRTNSKSVEVVDGWDELVRRAKPRMDVLGPEYGSLAGEIGEEIRGTTKEDLSDEIEVNGETVEITDEVVEYVDETPENVGGAEFGAGDVYVDATLDDEIESEGYSREVVRRIQEMRKELELDVEKPIKVDLEIRNDRVESLVDYGFVADETRADEFTSLGSPDLSETWDVEGVEIEIGVSVVTE